MSDRVHFMAQPVAKIFVAPVPLVTHKKNDQVEALDPLTQQVVMLFNPRQQRWSEHFQWRQNGTEIVGLTTCGRATVEALKMNNPRIVRARRLWVSVGWHPPQL